VRPDGGNGALRRELSPLAAVGVGLGSILGAGVFVALGLVAGQAGPWALPAIAIAAAIACCNGLSSAQLAAVHPVSGGTYAYGYRFLTPSLGFAAGWLFLVAKSASCAASALAMGGLVAWGVGRPGEGEVMVLVALGSLCLVVAAALAGVRRSAQINLVLVAVTIAALLALIATAAPAAARGMAATPWSGYGVGDVLGAAALAFVAFTGYGRIATMGEEVREPARTIPRAVVATIALALTLYLATAASALGVLGPAAYAAAAATEAAPLLAVTRALDAPLVGLFVAVGAASALLAVQLNLVLGLSRVVLAAAREHDLPPGLARVRGGVPGRAGLVVAAAAAALVLVGSVPFAWSLSAAAVLVYYGLTNAAALRVADGRFVPRWVSVAGLAGCVLVVVFLDVAALVVAAAVLGGGFASRRLVVLWLRRAVP